MRRKGLTILFIAISASLWALDVPCGSWIELRATGVEGWHFERWSDGDTDSVRQVEIVSDTSIVAYFAPNCKAYAPLPVVVMYDRLMMLHMDSIQKVGFFFNPEDVTWYRVKGIPDKPDDDASGADEPLGNGYYLTLDHSFVGTGDYYALVDISSTPSGERCTDYLQSELVCYSAAAPASARAPILEPTYVRRYEEQRLLHLDPNYPTTVTIYDVSGHRLQTLTAEGVERMSLQAQGVAGCYQIVVQNGEEKTILRYVVVR